MSDRGKDRHAGGERRRLYMRRYAREWALRKFFGLTVAEFNSMLSSQDNRCAICFRPFILDLEKGRSDMTPTVDHDHGTGAVRGLLCNSCNVSIGRLGESVETLQRAILYLERNKQAAPKVG